MKISLPNVDDKIQYSQSVSKMDNLWLFVYKQYILHISTSHNFALRTLKNINYANFPIYIMPTYFMKRRNMQYKKHETGCH